MISVITPTLNAALTLQACLDSVTACGCEHVIIDGGSTDGTLDIARRHDCEVIDAPGSGIYEAQNIGVAAATGEWVHFLGADDTLVEGAVDAVAEVISTAREDWVRVMVSLGGSPSRYVNQQQGFLYRKSLLEKYGGMDESVGLCADARFNETLRGRGEPCLKIPVHFANFTLGANHASA